MATNDVDAVVGYLRDHPEVTNVLITGGDALVMSAGVLHQGAVVLAVPLADRSRCGRFVAAVRLGHCSWPAPGRDGAFLPSAGTDDQCRTGGDSADPIDWSDHP